MLKNNPRFRFPFLALAAVLLVLAVAQCRKGEINADGIPNTKLAFDEINRTGANRLNSSVQLSWFGTDADGYIVGYEISLNQVDWFFTTTQDSVFLFDIPPGQDSADIDFYVRAIDNDNNVDPTPAYLKVPLINTPPNATLVDERGPGDTVFIAATFFWSATDPDGQSTLSKVQMKFNEEEWVTIDKNQNLITFLPDTSINSGLATAAVYYGTNTAPSQLTLNGLRVNDTNRLYIKAIDIAGSESIIDTSEVFYFKGKTPNVSLLWVNGHNESLAPVYQSLLDANNLSYDLLDLGNQTSNSVPKYFNPTVQLIFAQYSKAFINLPTTSVTSSITGESNTLLSFLAPVVQRFVDRSFKPGKYFITTSFNQTEDVSALTEVYPFSGLSLSNVPSSQARIVSDSALVAVAPGNYPTLESNSVQFGLVPLVASADAQRFYRAQLTKFRGWNGPSDVVALRRFRNGNLNEVFFGLELHNYRKNSSGLEQLIGDILINEF
jgi:hypothetical protein